MKIRYFLCTRDGGCRLADLDLFLDKGQVIERSNEVIEKSRAIRAASNAGWVEEIDKGQYDKINLKIHRDLRKREGEQTNEVNITKASTKDQG